MDQRLQHNIFRMDKHLPVRDADQFKLANATMRNDNILNKCEETVETGQEELLRNFEGIKEPSK